MICETCGLEFSGDYRKDPSQRKKPLRFCSRKCANASNNSKYKEERFCKHCGKSLGHNWKAQTRDYCSSTCAAQFQIAQKLEEWLRTGIIPNFSGGKSKFAPRNYIRRFISEAQQHKCSLCGIGDVWENRPLVFVLDHVDGDCENNQRSNLRLICPNCNSQTPTFSGRNRGKGKRPVRP